MTVKEVKEAMWNNRYVMFRTYKGNIVAVNCRIVAFNRCSINKLQGNSKTNIASFRPCSFNEYITYKRPFL